MAAQASATATSDNATATIASQLSVVVEKGTDRA
jgi:hypothetical protein